MPSSWMCYHSNCYFSRKSSISLKKFRARLLNTEGDIESIENTLSTSMAAIYVQGSTSQSHSGQGWWCVLCHCCHYCAWILSSCCCSYFFTSTTVFTNESFCTISTIRIWFWIHWKFKLWFFSWISSLRVLCQYHRRLINNKPYNGNQQRSVNYGRKMFVVGRGVVSRW